MFFLHELERVISLHPSFFGPRVKEYLKNKLLEDVEGTCDGSYYIICVVDPSDISEGRVVPGEARAEYTIRYHAVVWKPFKGEVVSWNVVITSECTLTNSSRLSLMESLVLSTVWVSLPT